jgi:hypothetical protein
MTAPAGEAAAARADEDSSAGPLGDAAAHDLLSDAGASGGHDAAAQAAAVSATAADLAPADTRVA